MDYPKEIETTNRAIRKLQMRCGFALFRDLGTHPGQFPILEAIHRRSGCTQSEIAREQCASNASVGMSVKRLESAGLLKKSSDTYDQRATRLELTPKGERAADEAMAAAERIDEIKLRGFSQEELAQYCDFLHRIRKNLEDYSQQINTEEQD